MIILEEAVGRLRLKGSGIDKQVNSDKQIIYSNNIFYKIASKECRFYTVFRKFCAFGGIRWLGHVRN